MAFGFAAGLRGPLPGERTARRVRPGPITMSLGPATIGEVALRRFADSVKYVTLGIAGSALVINHDAPTIVFLAGAIGNAVFGKIAKKLINQSRPDPNSRDGEGMPSSHALNLSFLATYMAIETWNVGQLGNAAGVALVSLALAASGARALVGYHTWAQVAVGAALGTLNAVLWHNAALASVIPLVHAHASREQLRIVTAIMLAVGVLLFSTKWRSVIGQPAEDP